MMKHLVLCSLFIFIVACGGGGGGGNGLEPSDAAEACSDYCSYACDRALDCLDTGEDVGNRCATECFAEIIGTGTADMCERAQDTIGNLNCVELLALLGLSRAHAAVDSTTLGANLAAVAEE